MSTVKLNVRVYPLDEPKSSTLAFANVGINDAVAISGIRVVKGTNGNFVAMPQSQDKNGEWRDIAFINNDILRAAMSEAVLTEFKNPTHGQAGQYIGAASSTEIDVNPHGRLDVKSFPIGNPQGNTLAFATITIDGLVTIHNARVVGNEKGSFVSMPQSKDKDGNFHDIAFPINAELRKEMSSAVLRAYNECVGEKKQSMSDRLIEGKQESRAYNAAQKAAPARATKSSPGRED